MEIRISGIKESVSSLKESIANIRNQIKTEVEHLIIITLHEEKPYMSKQTVELVLPIKLEKRLTKEVVRKGKHFHFLSFLRACYRAVTESATCQL